MPPIHPVILSGGAGTRLWPLSRELSPKQLHRLVGDWSLLQATAKRLADPTRFAPPLIVCNEEHRFAISQQLSEAGIKPDAIVLEPSGRNTAPAICVAALMLAQRYGEEALALVAPADHLIRRQEAFLDTVDLAARAAEGGQIVTFGIHPTHPETGYGYICRGPAIAGLSNTYAIARFAEKPDRATAAAYLADEHYSWNSGMFLFRVGTLIQHFSKLEPELLAACRGAIADAKSDLDFQRLGKSFDEARKASFDVAIMEKIDAGAVIPVEIGWSDVGSWASLHEIAERDPNGNAVSGDVILLDAKDNYVRTDGPLTALVGIERAVVVVTSDAVLVAAIDRVQDIKLVVDRLREANREEATLPSRVRRPWGWYETVDEGDRFKVKHIEVAPGHYLSLQKHYHRAEHWIVVKGVAEVTRGEDKLLLHENESIYIPTGTVHRLHNPGKVPLKLIEVQTGTYLGEDDIVRLVDGYGRT